LHYRSNKELLLEFRAKPGFVAYIHAKHMQACKHATWLVYYNNYLWLLMLNALHLSYEIASYNKITKKRYTKPSIIAITATKKLSYI